MWGLLRLLTAASVAGALAVLLRGLRKRHELMSPKDSEEPHTGSETSPGTDRDGAGSNRKELYEEAQRLEIPGRSRMNKRQLARAVGEAKETGR
jgi:hypothetical protein